MLDIFWIQGTPSVRLAIVLRPRGGDWLEDELVRIKSSGVEVLVSLLEAEEAEELGLDQEGVLATNLGLKFLSFPIQDRHIPPKQESFRAFAKDIADRLSRGEGVGIHCRGSIGRATITAACSLIHLGWKAEDALAAIEAARGCLVPDTPEQRAWILAYR
jgi:protein-tyrosine phosphatase